MSNKKEIEFDTSKYKKKKDRPRNMPGTKESGNQWRGFRSSLAKFKVSSQEPAAMVDQVMTLMRDDGG